MRNGARLMIILAMVAVAFTLGSPPVRAAVFDVNTTTDAGDSLPGDGICSASGVFCSLRAAIEEANTQHPPHTINLPAGTYNLTLGRLVMVEDITLIGAGAEASVVSGQRLSQVVAVEDGAAVVISNVTIKEGYEAAGDGAGLSVAAGCSLALSGVIVNDNECWGTGGAMAFV